MLLCNLVFLITGNPHKALSSHEIRLNINSTDAHSLSFSDGLLQRVNAAPTTLLPEPADAVLVQTNEWQWHRYLKHALNLPKWLDLGFEHRTRFEVYDHPWRSSQPLGRTDPQVQQRSRVRIGLNGGPFRFLFEWQDSRVHLSDLSDFIVI